VIQRLNRTLIFSLFLLVGNLSHAWGESLPLLSLQPDYHGEHEGLSERTRNQKVTYYTDPEVIQKNILTVKDGKFYTYDGKPFHTLGSKFVTDEGLTVPFDRAIVVMDEKNQFHYLLEPVAFETHHSTLVAGKPVKFAGEILVKDGTLELMTDRSGHYKPSLKHTHHFLDHLESLGVNVSKVEIMHDLSPILYFFESPLTQEEMHRYLRYSLRGAIIESSKNDFPFFMQFWNTFRQKPSIAELVDQNPKYLYHVFDRPLPPVSDVIQRALAPVIRNHSDEFFSDPARLAHLAETFSSKRIVDLLWEPSQKLLIKASEKGLGSLTATEMNILGITRSRLGNQSLMSAFRNGDRGRMKQFDQKMLELLNQSPETRIKKSTLGEIYREMSTTQQDGIESIQTVVSGKCSTPRFLKFLGI
jgi:hypothetical protein